VINAVWFLLIACGIGYAAWQGNIEIITNSAINGAEAAVTLAFKLVGVMCLWLGIMKIAETAGIVRAFSKIMYPFIRVLFPAVPKNHPAIGSIVMMISANMLGLGNAVTPLGIKAMQELQKLNSRKEIASAEMCTLLAICTTGFTIVPATIIALRSAAGSERPAEIVGVTLIVSFTATVSTLLLDGMIRIFRQTKSRR
jgi:spore maturation protein A